MKRHNKVFGTIIIAIILFVSWAVAGTDVPISGILGKLSSKVGVYLALVLGAFLAAETEGYNVLTEAKKTPLGVPILISALIVSAGLVCAGN